MENLGTRIAEIRKSHNMTQAELGEKLNITSQAVSKWENGLSEPDIGTMNKISRMFNMSIDELIGNTATKQVAAAQTNSVMPDVQPVVIVGYCNRCKKPIQGSSHYNVYSSTEGQKIFCDQCDALNKKDALQRECDQFVKERKLGFIWGAVTGAAMLLIGLILAFTQENGLFLPL